MDTCCSCARREYRGKLQSECFNEERTSFRNLPFLEEEEYGSGGLLFLVLRSRCHPIVVLIRLKRNNWSGNLAFSGHDSIH